MAFLSDKEDRELLESIQNGNTQETVLSAPKSRLISRCILLVSVVLVVFQLYTAFFGSFQSLIQRPVHVFLGSMLILIFYNYSSYFSNLQISSFCKKKKAGVQPIG